MLDLTAYIAAPPAWAVPRMGPAHATPQQPAVTRLRAAGLWLGLALPLTLALLHELSVRLGLVELRHLPPPSAVLATLADLATKGELLTHTKATTWRVLAGFAAGAAAATVIGALTGYVALARALLDPTLQALRNVPSIAWVPLFILWLGIFETSKVALIAIGVFFPVYLALASAVREADRKLVEVGRVLGLSSFDLVRRVIFPSVLPAYATGLRAGLGLGWMFVVAAEFMGASEGLGFLLVDGQMSGKPTVILAAILSFAVLGNLSDAALTAAMRPMVAWQDTHAPTEER